MADSLPQIDPADELTCLGHDEDVAAQGGALAPPVVQTSLFAQGSHADLGAGLADEFRQTVYTRGRNPTVQAVEDKLARLERGKAAKCFGSGMGAISAVLQATLAAGDHVLFVNQTYGPTLKLARHLERFGVEHDLLLELDPEAVAAALRPTTKLVWVESPGTMLMRVVDLPAVAAVAHEHGALTVHDNSWASPLFQKPLELGADLVVHSATKYVGGHSDVVAGAVVGSEELLEQIFHRGFLLGGAALAPWDAFLLNRGLRTLPLRMRRHHESGLTVARGLAEHSRVRAVHHPALTANPALLERQLTGFSGVLSFEIDSDSAADVASVVDRLSRFRIGVSWGGVESLVLAPNRGDNAEGLARHGLPAGLVRLSVGLEDPSALSADLDEALGAT